VRKNIYGALRGGALKRRVVQPDLFIGKNFSGYFDRLFD
jgi:hypothetical protein